MYALPRFCCLKDVVLSLFDLSRDLRVLKVLFALVLSYLAVYLACPTPQLEQAHDQERQGRQRRHPPRGFGSI
jgi:hypothetical protein